jgi:isoleucyl-tRNA synthetase
VDLSAVYSDVSKDRLYTFAARSAGRRSGQTAMFIMADGLTRLMAPILTFTADELWQYLPGKRDESVHMTLFPTAQELNALLDPELTARWDRLIAIREQVLAHIEPLRKDKKIGSSLQAKVVLSAAPADFALLQKHAGDLPMLFIVSDVELTKAAGPQEEGRPAITIERAGGVKCERCWRYVPAVSSEPAWSGLCGRCQEALAEPVNR